MDGVRFEDLCGLLSLDEATALSKIGVRPSEVLHGGVPLVEAFNGRIVPLLRDFVSRRESNLVPKWSSLSDACLYTIAAQAEWSADVVLTAASQEMVSDYTDPLETFGPWRYCAENFDGYWGRAGSWSSFSEFKFEFPHLRGFFGCAVRRIEKLGSFSVTATPLVLAVYRDRSFDRPTHLERSLMVYLMLVPFPHDRAKVQSLWTELCLLESGG
jgi:hypothetical protein